MPVALLLNIDTATETASVCVSEDARALAYLENRNQKEHASFIHPAISKVLDRAGVALQQIDAFAIAGGPGSYTGLRVGMATAKGFCYVFKKPLISINKLEIMAKAAIDIAEVKKKELFCPMIDARRMEVFLALYNAQLNPIIPPQSFILEENLFETFLEKHQIYFFGSGSTKLKDFMSHSHSRFLSVHSNAVHLAVLAAKRFYEQQFVGLPYSEPEYCKGLFLSSKKKP